MMARPQATAAYLDVFNAIDARLRKVARVGRQVPFKQVLRLAQDKDPTVTNLADDLALFNELRNMIVHNSPDLVEPLKTTLQRIRRIRRHLATPPLLKSMFVREVVSC